MKLDVLGSFMTTARKKKNNSIVNASISLGTREENFIQRDRAKGYKWAHAERWEETKEFQRNPLYFATLLSRLLLRYYCVIAASLRHIFLRCYGVISTLLKRFTALLPRYDRVIPALLRAITALLLLCYSVITSLFSSYYFAITALLLCYCFVIAALMLRY